MFDPWTVKLLFGLSFIKEKDILGILVQCKPIFKFNDGMESIYLLVPPFAHVKYLIIK